MSHWSPEWGGEGRSGVYLGIDPSLTSSGLCLMNAQNVFTKRIQTNKTDSLSVRLHYIREEFGIFLDENADPIEVVCIENVFSGPNKMTAHLLSCVTGIYLAELAEWTGEILHPPTKVYKKFVTGTGAAEKDHLVRIVEETWGYTNKCTDVVEAYAMAHFARCSRERNLYTEDQAILVQDFLRLKDAAAGAENE